MKKMVLHNPTTKDIKDYPISEAQIEEETGDAVINRSTGQPVSTGKTYEWNLKAGETLEFPAYVGRYLKGVYDFLDVMGESGGPEEEEVKEEVKEEKPKAIKTKDGKFVCKTCGKECKTAMSLGSHIGAMHPEML